MTLHMRPHTASKQSEKSRAPPPAASGSSSRQSAIAARKAKQSASLSSAGALTLSQSSSKQSSSHSSSKKHPSSSEDASKQRIHLPAPEEDEPPSDPHSAVPDSLFHNEPLPSAKRPKSPKRSASASSSSKQAEPQKKRRYWDQPVEEGRIKAIPGKPAQRILDLSQDSDDSEEQEQPVSVQASKKTVQAPRESDESSVSDSSDEESETPLRSEPRTPRVATPPAPEPPVASTSNVFQPEAGINIARVTFSDVKNQQRYGIAAGQHGVLLALKSDQAVSLCGTARLRVLSGEVQTHQATFSPGSPPLDLFAPSTHVLPRISAISTASSSSQLKACLSTGKFAPAFDASAMSDSSAVILLSPMTDTGIEGIEDLVKLSGIIPRSGTMWAHGRSEWSGTGFEVVYRETPTFPAAQPEDWEEAFERVVEAAKGIKAPIIASVGPKRAGKSTLAKCTVNRLLSTCPRVAWLDLDLGQAEFTPCGLASLHILNKPAVNPNFAQQLQPYRAHHIGDSNPSQDPDCYMAAVQDLVKAYHTLNAEEPLPLLINSYGWSRGLTGDVLDSIMNEICPPTHLMRFSSTPHDVVTGATVLNVSPLPDTEASRSLTAADHRTLVQLSYLHARPDQSGGTHRWDFSRPLSAKSYFSIKWTELQQVHIVGAEVDYEYALAALNGMIVGLVVSDEPPQQRAGVTDRASQLPYSQLASIPDPSRSQCLGLGIVRSIYPQSQELHILTSLSGQVLERCNALVRGKIELPIALLLHGGSSSGLHGVPWDQVPYLESTAGRQSLPGDTKRHVRRNAVRAGQA